jgi:hypothetical protein
MLPKRSKPEWDSWEERFDDLKNTCEMLKWVKSTQLKVSKLVWPNDPHLEVLCNQSGAHPAHVRLLSDADRAYHELHRLIGRFGNPPTDTPPAEELQTWSGILKSFIRGIFRKPSVERPADDLIYSLLRSRLRELYTEVIATNREFVWTDFRDLFLSLFTRLPSAPPALMQPSLQGAKLALRQPQRYRTLPTDVSEFYIAVVDRYEPIPALATNLMRECGDRNFSDEQMKQPLLFRTRAEADAYVVILNRSAYRAWFFVIDRVSWEGRVCCKALLS